MQESLVKDLLRTLRALDAEKDSAKADAKEHKERMDSLLEEAQRLRAQLEGGTQPGLFDPEPESDEPQRMTALDDAPGLEQEVPSIYDAGARARLAGHPEDSCPYTDGSPNSDTWRAGWREAADLEDVPEEA